MITQAYQKSTTPTRRRSLVVAVKDILHCSIHSQDPTEFAMKNGEDQFSMDTYYDIIEQDLISPSHSSYELLVSHLEKKFGTRHQSQQSRIPNRYSTSLERYSRIMQELTVLKLEMTEAEGTESQYETGDLALKQAGVICTIKKGIEQADEQLQKISKTILNNGIPLVSESPSKSQEMNNVDIESLQSTVKNVEAMVSALVNAIGVIQRDLSIVSEKLKSIS